MLSPLKALQKAVEAFQKLDCAYCLAGGHAASLYRSQARLTHDVDFALVSAEPGMSQSLAQECIRSLGLEPIMGWIPSGPQEPGRHPVCMITSKPPPDHFTGVIDILLPELPWVEAAVKRAQFNTLDLGFGRVPVITPEDLIVAKCYALRNSPDRFQDLDDLRDIFQSVRSLDIDYLRHALAKHSLSIPEAVNKYSPL